jgi:hypothetical protein
MMTADPVTINNEVRRRADLTLVERIHATQNAWTGFRNAQLIALDYAASVLTWARENEDDFLTYCKRNSIVGNTHETRVVELMLARDTESVAISRERRAECAACVGWFEDDELCTETGPDKAVALARQKGGITGIARAYREKKDAENPKAKAAKEKGQATKKARRQGADNNIPRAASAAAARVFAEQIDSQPPIIERTREAGQDFCAAAGNSDAMLAFMSRHGISAGLKQEFDDENPVQIYLRVWNSTENQFQLFGPALDPDLADNLADIIVQEHHERAPKVAEAV